MADKEEKPKLDTIIDVAFNPEDEGAFDCVTLSDGEYVAVLRHDEGHECRTSYLTRDFLEVVRNASPLYEHAADELAAEVLNSFSWTLISTEEEGFLAHRKLDDNLHAFSFNKSARKIDEDATEYLLTQPELDGIYEQAHEKIIDWLEESSFASDRAKKAANHNLAMLSRFATPEGP